MKNFCRCTPAANTQPGPKRKCRSSNLVERFALFLLIALFLPNTALFAAQPADHAATVRVILSKAIHVADSILPADTIALREGCVHPQNGLLRQVLIEHLTQKPGLVVVDSPSQARTILEYHIAALSVSARPMGGLSLWGRKQVCRSIHYDLRFNMSRDGRIVRSIPINGMQTDTLSHADFISSASSAHPELNPVLPVPAGSTLVDALIVLGIAGCLLYFLFL